MHILLSSKQESSSPEMTTSVAMISSWELVGSGEVDRCWPPFIQSDPSFKQCHMMLGSHPWLVRPTTSQFSDGALAQPSCNATLVATQWTQHKTVHKWTKALLHKPLVMTCLSDVMHMTVVYAIAYYAEAKKCPTPASRHDYNKVLIRKTNL